MSEKRSSAAVAPPGPVLRQVQEDLAALTKARLSVLVVMTTAFGYFVATKGAGSFSWAVLGHLVFGTALAAAGSAVFNQLMEVEADAKMRRTSDRPLPARRLPKPAAFVIGWILSAFGLVHLGVKVNAPASLLAGATLLTYLFVYTPMKRVSTANTLVGAVSGALPPLIGWAAGGGGADAGGLFLFALLFFWQLPHFAAINWMYREEYLRGGFKMWSNDDESGARTGRIAFGYAVCLAALGLAFPLAAPQMAAWGAAPGLGLGVVLVLAAQRFRRSGERADARRLFLLTLLYLPLMMAASYLAWTSPGTPQP